MQMTDLDLDEHLSLVIRYTCLKIGVPESGGVGNSELLARVATAAPQVYQSLLNYVTMYAEWFQVGKKVLENPPSHNSTETDRAHFSSLTHVREELRQRLFALLEAFAINITSNRNIYEARSCSR